MKFEKIIVAGYGKVALNALNLVNEYFNLNAEFIDTRANLKDYLTNYFNKLKNTLIISVNNFYIFSKSQTQNNTIINYHNSLLPKHKGVNAHIFAIYDNDEKSGISWHLVDEKIDNGQILIQKEIKLDKSLTAMQLLLKQHKLAISSLKQALDFLMNNKIAGSNSLIGGGFSF